MKQLSHCADGYLPRPGLIVVVVLLFLLTAATSACCSVFVNYTSSNGFLVLLPDVSDVAHDSTSRTCDISIENNQEAWYYVTINKVGSGPMQAGIPDSIILGPHQKVDFGRVRFYDHNGIFLVADGTANHYQVPAMMALDALYRFTTGSAWPTDLTAAFWAMVGNSPDLASKFAAFGSSIYSGDVFGAVHCLTELAQNDLLRAVFLQVTHRELAAKSVFNSLGWAVGSMSAIRFEMWVMFAPRYDSTDIVATGTGSDTGCSGSHDAGFQADVTVPDGSVLNPNQAFTKTWRIRNTGSCDWGSGHRFVFDGGDRMGGPDYIDAPMVSSNASWQPSVALHAPGSPGVYRGYWRMQASDGQKFGDRVWIEIQVLGSNPGSAVTTVVSESSGAAYEGAPGFWRHGTAGYWHDAWSIGDGGHALWTYNNDPTHGIDNMGDWRPNLPETRWYELYVFIPSNYATSAKARYEIYHADGRTDVVVNQNSYYDQWVSLGIHRFNNGSSNYLRLADMTDEPGLSKQLGFDTAKWEPRDAPPPVTTYVSESSTAPYEGAPGFLRHGTSSYWHNAAIGEGGHMYWTYNNDSAHGIDNVGDWRPNLPESRWYEVYVFIPHNYATTMRAKYEVHHADGVADIVINQFSYNDQWVSLGTYRFDSGSGDFLRLVDMTTEGYGAATIGFDAAKWEPRDSPPTVTTYVSESMAAAHDGDPGFWRSGTGEYWHDAAIGEGGHMYWTYNNDAAHGVDNVGKWTPDLPESRWYEVYVYIPYNYATATRAHYEVNHADGTADVTINQYSYSDQWVSLGTYRFNSGCGGCVRLTDMTGESYGSTKIGFDAAKWEARDAPPPVTTYVSESAAAAYDGAPGFWRRGTSDYWHDAAIGDGGHMYWTYNNDSAHGVDNIGDWRPSLPENRWYEVFVYIPSNYATTTRAHYELYHADGRADVTINQYNYSDQWVSLGTYRFASGSVNFLRLLDLTSEGYGASRIGFDSAKWEPRDAPPPISTHVSESNAAAYDGAPGFWRRGTSDYWHDAGIGDGGHMYWTYNNDDAHGVDNSADWRPILPYSCDYEVFVYIPNNYATTRQAHYEIHCAAGRADATVNQWNYSDEWVSLGVYPFSAGSGDFVRLVDLTGEAYGATKVGFDSVKWIPRVGNPYAPTDLQPGSGMATSQSVALSWHDSGTDQGKPCVEFRVQIWQVVSGQRGDLVLDSDWLPGTSREWIAPGPGDYEWAVSAGNGMGTSASSEPAGFHVVLPLEGPTGLSAIVLSANSVELSWRDNSKDETGFIVERKSGDAQFVEAARVSRDTIDWSDTGLTPGTTYTYRVRAYNDAVESGNSNEAMTTPNDKAPPSVGSVQANPTLVAGGDAVHVVVHVTDDIAVQQVTANGALLLNSGGDAWEGDVIALPGLGSHVVVVVATDGAGNVATNDTGIYSTTRVFGVVGAHVRDQVVSRAIGTYLFRVWGQVTKIDSDTFTLDDGSGVVMKVVAPNHPLKTSDYGSARGVLDPTTTPPTLTSSAVNTAKMN